MEIGERRAGDVIIVTPKGEISLNAGSDLRLNDKVRSLLQQGHRRIVIDLGEVPYVDSSGLGQLVQIYATTRRAGGELKLLHLTKRLHDLLVVTKLLTVFEAFDQESEALASFGEGPR